MSSSDRLLLILHIGFAIFTLGPLTAATSVTPRYIRRRDVAVLRYLNRTTRIYGLGTLGILLFGLFLSDGDYARVWLTASITLFIVALVLLLIVERDQRKAVHLLQLAAADSAPSTEPDKPMPAGGDQAGGEQAGGDGDGDPVVAKTVTTPATDDIAQVERGRIASLSGVIALIWLVILALMVWNG